MLINKRSRETAEKTRINIRRKSSPSSIDIANRVQKFVDCRTKDVERRELYIVEGDSALGACKQSRDAEFQGHDARPGQDPELPEGRLRPHFQKRRSSPTCMKVLGCGVEVSGKAVKDLNQLRLEQPPLE